ncbi:MAG: MATE family efflux transporter [Alphaproteobacteria bacterium]|nr:MAG: MATE family efflux transporter [Alphaproteobacteria bacterium]
MGGAAGGAGPVSHRRVLAIALPIVLSNATVPILGAVDTGVVGQLGAPEPIGAVGLGAVILGFVYWLFGFLRMGTTGLAAQARGAGDRTEVSAILMRALIIAAAGGLAIILLRGPIFALAFTLSPASAEVEAMARSYMGIRVLSAPAAIALYGITGWLIAAERARAVLAVQLATNGFNVVLDLWFVLGLGWGVEGVASATVIAELSGAALGLWLCRDALGRGRRAPRAALLDVERLARMMAVSTDILIRSALLQLAMVGFMFLGAGFGDVTLAANQILFQFLHVTAYGLDGFAFAAEALVGGALGARDRPTLRRAALLASLWGGAAALALALGFALAGPAVIDTMTTAPEVRAEARRFLPWMVAAPLAGLPSWMLDGIFIGATRTRDMRNMMAVSFVLYALALALLVPAAGNHGLWAGLLWFFVVRAITLGTRYPALEAAAGPAPRSAG